MIAAPGWEEIGHRRRSTRSQGKEWGGSETGDLSSEQGHSLGWVSVPHEMETALLVSVTFQLWCRNNLS